MSLLGGAAMLLSFDVEAGAIEEHDRWHTQEHLPERLSIPGFLRGTRWTGRGAGPRYMVLYEVDRLETLASAPYLERLNAPTPWTARMMPHYRGMNRGLCAVRGSVGLAQGGAAALVRFRAEPARADSLTRWLLEEALPSVLHSSGLGGAHLLEGAQAAAMTQEQRIRGADLGMDSALILTGYGHDAVASCANGWCAAGGLADRGAQGLSLSTYEFGCSLACAELDATRGATLDRERP